ncbi:MAG: hypothetical protein ACOX6Y_02865 [Christensenellales bacterium]|jgi:hypothetical protein
MSNENYKSSNDVNELRDVLDTVSERVPKLIKDVVGSIYSREAGASMGQSVGAYYQELIASGIPQEAALEMAKSYSISMKDLFSKNFSAEIGDKHRRAHEEHRRYDPHEDSEER